MMLSPYMADPYATELDTDVLGCEPMTGDDAGRFAVRLRESIFYPTGGGQPHDTGSIRSARVVDVRPDAGRAIHVTLEAVESGRAPTSIDWDRRFDHMQQHTGQHLLTAVTQSRFGWGTTSFHLGAEDCAIDLDADDTALTKPRLVELEGLVNAEIRAARLVSSRMVDRASLEREGVRTRGVPGDVAGPLRVVEIDGVDLNTCGGTHVRNTAELQVVKLTRVSNMHGHARLHFLVGRRVLWALEQANERERELTRRLSAGPAEHVRLVGRLQDSAKVDRKLRGVLLGELASVDAQRLTRDPHPVVELHREGADMDFLQRVAGVLAEQAPQKVALLTASEVGEDAGVFLVVGPEALVAEVGPAVAAAMSGRGGGRGGRFQGKGDVSLHSREDAVRQLSGR